MPYHSSLHWLGYAFFMSTFSLLPAHASGYSEAVAKDAPLAYYRFNDTTQRVTLNLNSGSLGAAGNATNLNTHLIPGAVVANRDAATYFDSTARAVVPWTAALNPSATNSFTIEAWFYPTSDKVAGSFSGPAPLMNRYSYSGADRQGWVYFQRNPDTSYAGDGQTDVGWNFRTYTGSGSGTGIDLTSQVPYRLGQWQHVVTTWDATTLTATMFVDGVQAATQTWASDGPAYAANSADHPASEAIYGPAGLGFGSYNNTQPGENPFRGAIDEVAFYAKKLTDAQILAHYQNATNAARTLAYDAVIQADGPVRYWRLDDPAPGPDVAINLGLLQSSGMATNLGQVKHPSASPIAATTDSGYGFHSRNGGNSTTDMPWVPENNPDVTVPFSVEAWFRPLNDLQNPGPSPINNRLAGSAANRTGWVIYQRAPNDTYSSVPGYEGVGWDFRFYTGSGHDGLDVVSGIPYTIGAWQHVVVTWDGTNTSTMFVNGAAAATNSAVVYAANTNPPAAPDDALPPADLAIGSYNAASGFGEEFEGDIDEVAIYTNLVLRADQVLAHYQAGTNSHRATNYETLVLTSPYDAAGTQALQPVTYFRFNEPAFSPATNGGTLGTAVPGDLIAATYTAGPQAPAFPGFESSNQAVSLDGSLTWVSLNNPDPLNLVGLISMEAWIKPDAVQSDTARIISHGPPTLSSYDSSQVTTNGSVLSGSEVILGLQGKGTSYVVGTSDGTNFHGASVAIPAGDLGSGQWLHLVGTFDGSNWRLYRNGSQIASAADTNGALPVLTGEWAIGSAGNGWQDNFAGAVDEVAIYNQPLSLAQVQAHFTAATAASSLTLTISLQLGKIALTWPAGTLQVASQVTGPFADVPAAVSPLTLSPQGTAQFYRLR